GEGLAQRRIHANDAAEQPGDIRVSGGERAEERHAVFSDGPRGRGRRHPYEDPRAAEPAGGGAVSLAERRAAGHAHPEKLRLVERPAARPAERPQNLTMPTTIHPTAIVEPGAQLGADCEIMAHAIVTKHCVLGDRVTVHPFAVIGGDPQYLKFDRALATGVR